MNSKRNDIDQFLDALNRVPENVDINKVHQMLNQPTTVARWSETNSFKPLKLLTMTGIITAGIVAWLVWPTLDNMDNQNESKTDIIRYEKATPINEEVDSVHQKKLVEFNTTEQIEEEGSVKETVEVSSDRTNVKAFMDDDEIYRPVPPLTVDPRQETLMEFFEVLPQRNIGLSKKMNSGKHIKMNTALNIINYEREKIIDRFESLKLSQELLEKLNVKLIDNYLQVPIHDEGCDNVLIGLNRKHIRFLGANNKSDFNVRYTSNDKGHQWIKWRCKQEEKDFLVEYQQLIPVMLEQKKYPNVLDEDLFLWFESTPEFLALIPGEIGDQIRKEYEYLTSEDKSGLESSCTFFEACRSTLHIHDLKLYPNPNSGPLTSSFTLPEDITTDISITDMNGMEVLTLNKQKFLAKGAHQLEFDVSNLPSGMYLFVIHGDSGFVSQRLIIQ